MRNRAAGDIRGESPQNQIIKELEKIDEGNYYINSKVVFLMKLLDLFVHIENCLLTIFCHNAQLRCA